jgi:RNA polymerase sigma factor (sigma-70 family)
VDARLGILTATCPKFGTAATIGELSEKTDTTLLRAYAEAGSEPAFAELVKRYVDFVYSAALRMVRDAHSAEDVTQAVFVALAKDANQLLDRSQVAGWLHRTAQNIAAQTVRTEVRRRAREKEASAMNEINRPELEVPWQDIAPRLDAALGELNEPDRDALLLRYFQGKSAREMGEILSIPDSTAQKRLNRAVERLRELFANQGIKVSAIALVPILAANAVQAAPVGLALTIATSIAAATGTASLSGSTALAATKTIAMTGLQKTIVAFTLSATIGAAIYEAREAEVARCRLTSFQQQSAVNSNQLADLARERDAATNELSELREDKARMARELATLPRLRGQAALANNTQQELMKARADANSNRHGERISRLANDPEFKEEMRAISIRVLKNQYGPLFKQWALEPEAKNKLIERMADHQQRNVDLTMGLLDGRDASELQTEMTADRARFYSEVKTMVGEDRLQQLKSFEDSVADRTVVNSLGTDLLSADQSQQLLAIMLEERAKYPLLANRSDAANRVAPYNAQETEQFFQQQEQMNEQVSARAGAFLSTEQIERLRKLQSDNLVAQRKDSRRTALLFEEKPSRE